MRRLLFVGCCAFNLALVPSCADSQDDGGEPGAAGEPSGTADGESGGGGSSSSTAERGLLPPEAPEFFHVEVDDESFYLATSTLAVSGAGRGIYRYPKDGTGELVQVTSGISVEGIVLIGGYVVYQQFRTNVQGLAGWLSKDGSEHHSLEIPEPEGKRSLTPNSIVTNGETAFLAYLTSSCPSDPAEITPIYSLTPPSLDVELFESEAPCLAATAASGPYLYYATAEGSRSRIARRPVAGGAEEVLASGVEVEPFRLAIAGDVLYFVTDGTVWSAPADGGAPSEVSDVKGRGIQQTEGVALVGSNSGIYELGPGGARRLGDSPEATIYHFRDFAIDAGFAYFLGEAVGERKPGQLLRVAR